MFNSSKKGAERTLLRIIIEAVFVIGVILTLVYAGSQLYKLYSNNNYLCTNYNQWEFVDRAVSSFDDGEDSYFFFNNDNCNLVSFSPSQSLADMKIFPTFEYNNEYPRLCMCNIKDTNCKPFNCHVFKNARLIQDSLTKKQFSTSELRQFTYISLSKLGDTILINAKGTEKSAEPVYANLERSELNSQGLINKLVVVFNTKEIKSFIPIVSIKENSVLTPQGLPKQDKLPFIFNIDLALSTNKQVGIEQFKSNHVSISPNKVQEAYIELFIPKEIISDSSSKLFLYSKSGSTWKSSPLVCNLLDTKYLCSSFLNTFSDEFAISVPSIQTSFIGTTDLEARLTPLINDLSIKYSVDPLLVKSIIQQESRWNIKAISKNCGAAGFMQLMPGTARSLNLNVFEDSDLIHCNQAYTERLTDFLNSNPLEEVQLIDNRFDPDLALDAGIRYISKITSQLKKAGIDPSIENIAAAYNAGPNAVIRNNGVPDIPETKNYASIVSDNYQKLLDSSFVLNTDKVWPVSNPVISSCYGKRILRGLEDWHDGTDISVPEGTSVMSSADGVVLKTCSENCGSGGLNIFIKHTDNTYTAYFHLSSVIVNVNDRVSKGQVIAKSGNTGDSTGSHLDFKVYYSNNFSPDIEKPSYRRDPLSYLPVMTNYKFDSTSCKDSPTVIALADQGAEISNV